MGMRKQLFFAVLALAGWMFPQVAEGQFIGDVSPQSVTQVLTGASPVACTGSNQQFEVQNLGQTHHEATLTVGIGGPTQITMQILGKDVAGFTYPLSDDAQGVPSSPNTTMKMSVDGWAPHVIVQVLCSPGSSTFTLSYAGTSWAGTFPAGATLESQVGKIIFQGPSAGSTISKQFQTPYGNAAGTALFIFGPAGPSGSSLSLACVSAAGAITQTWTFNLATTNGMAQIFKVPQEPCIYIYATYTAGGASASQFTLEYLFAQPGNTPPAQQYAHITGTTATELKSGWPGYLHSLTINTGAAGTVSFFDLPSASCTGAPSTGTVAVATATTSTLQTLTYDVNFLTGICVKASAAMDLTVSYQ